MPRYDLAGNELPDDPKSSTPPPPTGQSRQPIGQQSGVQQRPGNWQPPPQTANWQQRPPAQPGNWQPGPPSNQPGVWPPAPMGAPAFGQSTANTSGDKAGVPPEVEALKWNWGAFALPWFWCLSHKLRIYAWPWFALNLVGRRVHGVAGVIAGLLAFGLQIYLGLNGHKLAWQNRRFMSLSEYMTVQTIWMRWGIGLFTLGCVAICAAIYFIMSAGGSLSSFFD